MLFPEDLSHLGLLSLACMDLLFFNHFLKECTNIGNVSFFTK